MHIYTYTYMYTYTYTMYVKRQIILKRDSKTSLVPTSLFQSSKVTSLFYMYMYMNTCTNAYIYI